MSDNRTELLEEIKQQLEKANASSDSVGADVVLQDVEDESAPASSVLSLPDQGHVTEEYVELMDDVKLDEHFETAPPNDAFVADRLVDEVQHSPSPPPTATSDHAEPGGFAGHEEEMEANKENAAPRVVVTQAEDLRTSSGVGAVDMTTTTSKTLPVDDRVLLSQLKEALDRQDEGRITYIRRSVRERNEEQWLRLFGMLEARHQTDLQKRYDAHQSDIRHMESQIQRELAEERLTLDKRLAQHKTALENEKEESIAASPGPSDSASAAGGGSFARFSSLDAPISRALQLGAAGGHPPHSTRAVHDPLHQCVFEGRPPLRLSGPEDRRLVEDVRLKLEEHRIRDEMRENDDMLRDDELDQLESELLHRRNEGLRLGNSPTVASAGNSLVHSRSREESLLSQSAPTNQKIRSHRPTSDTDALLYSPESPYQHQTRPPPLRRQLLQQQDSPSMRAEEMRAHAHFERQISELREQLHRVAVDGDRARALLQTQLSAAQEHAAKVDSEREMETQLRRRAEEENVRLRSRLDQSPVSSSLSRRDQQLIQRVMEECESLTREVETLRQQLQNAEEKLYDTRGLLNVERTRCTQLETKLERLENENHYLLQQQRHQRTDGGPRSPSRGGSDAMASLRRSIASLEEQKLIEPSPKGGKKTLNGGGATANDSVSGQRRRSRLPAEQPYSRKGDDLAQRIEQVKLMEKTYDDLQLEKRKVETQLSRCPSSNSGRYNRHAREEREALESRLDDIDKQLGSLRMTLKQYQVLKS